MISQQRPQTWPSKLPDPHPQWAQVDLAELLALPTVHLAIGYSNSILSERGAQAHERLWERARRPGGAIGNTIKLVHAGRAAGVKMVGRATRSSVSIIRSRRSTSHSTTTGPPAMPT